MLNSHQDTYFNLDKELDTGKIRRVYLISAYDSFLSDIFIKKIINLKFKNAGENIFYRYGDDVGFEDVTELCYNYSSLFAQEKLVVVKRCEKFSKDLNQIKDYIGKPDSDTILILLFDKNFIDEKKLFKDFDIADFSALAPDELFYIIKSEFDSRGLIIDKNTINLFISLLPENLSVAINEIDKIYNYLLDTPEKTVNESIILKLAGYEPELTPSELIKAIFNKDNYKALTICDNLINKSGFNEIYLLYLLFNYYTDILCFKSKTFNNANRSAAYGKYKIWGEDRWEIGNIYASRIGFPEIEYAVSRITDTDKKLKSTMLDPKVLVTSLVEELTNFSKKRN